jgi:hypothetical protein
MVKALISYDNGTLFEVNQTGSARHNIKWADRGRLDARTIACQSFSRGRWFPSKIVRINVRPIHSLHTGYGLIPL